MQQKGLPIRNPLKKQREWRIFYKGKPNGFFSFEFNERHGQILSGKKMKKKLEEKEWWSRVFWPWGGFWQRRGTVTFRVDAFPSSATGHLIVRQSVHHFVAVDHGRSDDDSPSRQIHAGGQCGRGDDHFDVSLPESLLNYAPFVHG